MGKCFVRFVTRSRASPRVALVAGEGAADAVMKTLLSLSWSSQRRPDVRLPDGRPVIGGEVAGGVVTGCLLVERRTLGAGQVGAGVGRGATRVGRATLWYFDEARPGGRDSMAALGAHAV